MRDRDRIEYVDFVTERYSGLCRTAYLLTGSHQTAEDVVQAALTRAFVHWASGPPGGLPRRLRTKDRGERGDVAA
jgi:DNA-directed RNA polymerase specialized sigma24 family protein